MSRTKGVTNKKPDNHPEFLDMPEEERLVFIASLIVDQILEEPKGISELLNTLGIEEAMI